MAWDAGAEKPNQCPPGNTVQSFRGSSIDKLRNFDTVEQNG
jgi:hypothetical protein